VRYVRSLHVQEHLPPGGGADPAVEAILRATDGELLTIRGIGPAALTQLRTIVPQPAEPLLTASTLTVTLTNADGTTLTVGYIGGRWTVLWRD
jgi:hypothetical protein